MRKATSELARVAFAVNVLRDAGMRGFEIEQVFLGRHSDHCACWQCIFRLRNEVILHQVGMKARAGWLSTLRFACEADPVPERLPHDVRSVLLHRAKSSSARGALRVYPTRTEGTPPKG